MARADKIDPPPYDVDPASDKEWPPTGEPFRVVLVFNNDAGDVHYNAFLEAWLIYASKPTKGGCHQSKWPMIRAQKVNKASKDDFNRIIVHLQTTPVPGASSSGGRIGTGIGTVYGSSSTPPPSGTVTQCSTTIPNL